MRHLFLTSIVALGLALPATTAAADPYAGATTIAQCNEAQREVKRAVAGATVLMVLFGGQVNREGNRRNYEACIARVSAAPTTHARPVTNQHYGGKVGASSGHYAAQNSGRHIYTATCPPGFNGMFRGTLYCINGRPLD